MKPNNCIGVMKMKNEIFIQINDREVNTKDIVDKIKDNWKKEGKLIKNLKDIKIYFNIKEQTIYVIINNKEHMVINQVEVEKIE